MELRHLRYFVAVAESGTIARAAARLHISESPLSRQIVDLERDVGVPLFERLPRGMRLTPAGVGLLADARKLLDDAAQARGRARAAAEAAASTLRVGYSDAPGLTRDIMRAVTLAFRASHPEVRLLVDATPPSRQLAEVRDGHLDAGCTVEVVDDPALASEPLLEYAYDGVLLSAAHPAAAADVVSLDALRDQPVLTFPHPRARSQWPAMVPAFEALGFASAQRDDVENSAAGFALVAAGAAWVFAPASVRDWMPRGVAYCRVAGLHVPFEERLVWRHADASPALLAFVAAVRRERDDALRRAPPGTAAAPHVGTAP